LIKLLRKSLKGLGGHSVQRHVTLGC